MTDQNITSLSSSNYHVYVGVLKYDFKTAGYPEVYKIAKKMSQDKNFLQLLVRKVSQENWGIQFIFALPKEELPEGLKHYTYFRNTFDYAFDVSFALDLSISQASDATMLEDNWLVQKPFMLVRSES